MRTDSGSLRKYLRRMFCVLSCWYRCSQDAPKICLFMGSLTEWELFEQDLYLSILCYLTVKSNASMCIVKNIASFPKKLYLHYVHISTFSIISWRAMWKSHHPSGCEPSALNLGALQLENRFSSMQINYAQSLSFSLKNCSFGYIELSAAIAIIVE
jgi:hypothetical protein